MKGTEKSVLQTQTSSPNEYSLFFFVSDEKKLSQNQMLTS